jgi:acyl-CoA dehydrogenase
MDFAPTPRAAELATQVRAFVDERIVPVEHEVVLDIAQRRARGEDAWPPHPVMAQLQSQARAEGLWNLFLPAGHEGPYAQRYGTAGGRGLSNSEYAVVAEQTGRIRSAFLMTEPGVASSDATTMQATAILDGEDIVLNGRKWWSTGAGHPDCRVGVFMGLTDPSADRHLRHSMVLVPMDAPGVRVERMLTALGHFDEPLGHGEVTLTDVRLPRSAVIGGPGMAFAIAQGRLGPGRVHHCMRLIGLAERSLELACERATTRVAFGKPLANLGGNRERLARARIAINQARLLVHHAAWKLDTVGIAGAQSEVSEIKAAVPSMACEVIDLAIQLHGGAGMSEDFPLAAAYAGARSLRLADGPDEVHLGVVARQLLRPYLSKES